jgi:hypothetical protein
MEPTNPDVGEPVNVGRLADHYLETHFALIDFESNMVRIITDNRKTK